MSLSTWRSALQNVALGIENAIVLCIGDSLTAGCASTGNQMGSNARSGSWPAVMAGLMTNAPASAASWFGDANAPGDGKTLPQYDSRITMSAGWTATTNNLTVGHYAQSQQSANLNALSFAPGVEFDRIRVYYACWDTSPEYTINIGGATLATLNMDQDAYNGTAYEDVTCALGTNTLNIVATGDWGSINGAYVYKSSVKQVTIINGGWWGVTTAEYASDANGYQPLDTLAVINPDLTIIMLGGNDCLSGTAQAAFKASLGAVVDAALAVGDVLLVGFTPVNPTTIAEATQDTYIGYISDVATTKGVDFLNLKSRAGWTNYAAAVSAGFKDADGIHNTGTGSADIAAAIRELIDLAPQQVLAPVSDIADGAWTPSTGTDLYACVDEATYSDADYIAATTATTCELAFAAGTDPASSVDHALQYRLLAGNGTIAVALKQGAATIASFGPHTLTGVAQAMQQALSGAQADSITDYAALSVAITAAANPNITYVGGQVGGRAGSTSTSNVTFALTGGSNSTPQAGDLVIIGCAVASQARTPACAISGYTAQTQINANGTTYDTSLNMSYKFMGGTPDTTFTLPSTGNIADAQRYTVQVWRGVDAATPLDVAVVAASGTATGRPNPGAITPVTAGAMIGIIGAGAAATGASYTAPANYTTGFLTGTTADTNDAMIGAGRRSWTSGAEDPANYTGGTTNAVDSWAAFTYALRPKAIDAKVSWISFQTPEAASGALAAAASGAALASGSATLAGQIALAAVGVAAAGGSSTAGVAVPLSAAGIATAGGSANRSAAITISAAGLAQAAGQAGLAVGVQVAAAGAAAATGNATLAGQIALAAAGAAQAAGNATLAAQLAAIAAGAAQASGSANLTGGAGGQLSATGGASATGSATLVAQIAAVAAGLATAAGSVNAGAKIAAGASGTATAAGAAAAGAQVAGGGGGSATASGSAALRVQLAAIAAGGSLAGGSAALVTLFAVFASASAQSAGSATAGIGRAAAATGAAQASGQGALSVSVSLTASGNAAASGNATGNLQAAGSMHAAGQVQSGGSAMPSVLARIVAAGYSAATGSAGGSLATSLAG